MDRKKYYKLITDMREAARLALHTAEDRTLVCELCGLKLTQCANEFEKLRGNWQIRRMTGNDDVQMPF